VTFHGGEWDTGRQEKLKDGSMMKVIRRWSRQRKTFEANISNGQTWFAGWKMPERRST